MRVLVVGHQRSGTSWVGATLCATGRAHYISEPEDATHVPFAMRALAQKGTFPVLRSEDPGWPDLIRLWDAAFGVGRVRNVRGQHWLSAKLFDSTSIAVRERATSVDGRVALRLRVAAALAVPRHAKYSAPDYEPHSITKSVHGSCMIDWIVARWQPAVVICFRHPLEIVASFLEVGLLRGSGKELLERMAPAARAYGRDVYGVPEPTGEDPVPYVAWRVGFVMSWLDDACRAHPEFHAVEHEYLCDDPMVRLQALVGAIGLEWTAETAAFVEASNQPGTAYEIRRIAREQRGRWQARLAPDDIRSAHRVLARFPISTRYEGDFTDFRD